MDEMSGSAGYKSAPIRMPYSDVGMGALYIDHDLFMCRGTVDLHSIFSWDKKGSLFKPSMFLRSLCASVSRLVLWYKLNRFLTALLLPPDQTG